MMIPRSSTVTGGEEGARVELVPRAGEDADRAGAEIDELFCGTGRAVDLRHAGRNNAAIRSQRASGLPARRRNKRPFSVAASRCSLTCACFEGRIGGKLSPHPSEDNGDFRPLRAVHGAAASSRAASLFPEHDHHLSHRPQRLRSRQVHGGRRWPLDREHCRFKRHSAAARAGPAQRRTGTRKSPGLLPRRCSGPALRQSREVVADFRRLRERSR